MYEYIKGTFEGINKDYIIIDNNGIGYKIFTSGNTMSSIGQKGESVKIFVHQIVREDFLGLYGFSSMEELNMFNQLLTINGVGAKAALSLLSIFTVDRLKVAIASSEEKSLIKASGVGKKMAQRIILELKDKIDIKSIIENDDIELSDGMKINIEEESKLGDVMGALMALGYTDKEAQNSINDVDKSLSVEEIIKECLKNLMS